MIPHLPRHQQSTSRSKIANTETVGPEGEADKPITTIEAAPETVHEHIYSLAIADNAV